MASVVKLLGAEISIASANTVANATAMRIINTGAAAVLNVAYSNGVVYANATITNTEIAYIQKNSSDTVVGANMKAAPIAFTY